MKSLAFLAAFLAFAGIARADDADPSSDEAGLTMQMNKVESDLKASSALIRDPALNAYIHGVVCRLAKDKCGALRLYVVDMPDFNSISLPNGALVISSGLLLRSENEAQLAFLLGHELAHYLDRHAFDQFDRKMNTTGAVAILGTAAAGAGIYLVGSAASIAALNASYPHSLSEERDADADGLRYAVAAGYDPAEAPKVWGAIMAEEDFGKDRDVFLAAHPRPKDRLEALGSLAAAARGKMTDWILATNTFRNAMAPYREQWAEEELARGESAESLTLFTRLSSDDSGLMHYALGETYRKRAQPGDADKARGEFHAALDRPGAPPITWRGLGLVAMKAGDKDEARNAFTQYRLKLPDAGDKAMIDFYLARL